MNDIDIGYCMIMKWFDEIYLKIVYKSAWISLK